MMMHHPGTTVMIEGHESEQERLKNPADLSTAQERHMIVSYMMTKTKCNGGFDSIRPARRVVGRDWKDDVVRAAGWGNGALGSHHVELFFTLDGVEIPTRSEHYAQDEDAAPYLSYATDVGDESDED